MEEQVHGGDRYGRQEMLDFSENTNPLGMPEGAKKALMDSVDMFGYYPDPLCRDLTAALAEKDRVDPAWIQFGNGAADLIYRAVFALRPKRALTLAPTFAEYEFALRAVGCDTAFHTLYEKDGFQLTETFLKKLSPALDLVILCNPNNPTGQPAGQELLLRVAKKCAECGITLLMDECFVPFLDVPEEETLLGELARYPNVLVLGAFTKIYAMAGLRLGYLYCADEERRNALNRCAPPWNVSVPAQIAGLAALADKDYLERTRTLIHTERTWLSAALSKTGVTPIGSRADYLFFKCNACPDLAKRLEEKGILIRACGNYRGLDDRFSRVGVKTREMNEKLVAAMSGILKGA